jgi:hypothetical protein
LIVGLVVGIPIVAVAYKRLGPQGGSYLLTYILGVLIFVFIFNRRDLAYPLAIFNAITVAALTTRGEKFGEWLRKALSIGYIPIFVGIAIAYIATGFERGMELPPRSDRISNYSWHHRINSEFGRYYDDGLVLVNKHSTFKIGGINDQALIYSEEISLGHIWEYFDQFSDTAFGKKYQNTDLKTLRAQLSLLKNVGFLEVDDRHEAINAVKHIFDVNEAIYVDENDRIEKLIVE